MKTQHALNKTIKGILWFIGGLILLFVLVIIAGGIWLTPERLTNLVNKELSSHLDAEVKASNIDYKFWSTFPDLEIELDSITIRSRALNHLTDQQTAELPEDADQLLSSGKIKAGVDILGLLKNEIKLTDIAIDNLNLNLLAVNDSTANYLIFPAHKHKKTPELPDISFNEVRLSHTAPLRFRNLARNIDAVIIPDTILSRRIDSTGKYMMNISGLASAAIDDKNIISSLPFQLKGDLQFSLKPVSVETEKLLVSVGDMESYLSTSFIMDHDNPVIKSLKYDIDNFNPGSLINYLSQGVPDLKNVDIDFLLAARLNLLKPYNLSDTVHKIPSAELNVIIPSGDISLKAPYIGDINLSDVNMLATLNIDGDEPNNSSLILRKFNIGGEGTDLSVNGKITDLLEDPHVSANLNGVANLDVIGNSIGALRKIGLKGNFTTDTGLDFKVSYLKDGKLDRINIAGKSTLKDLSAHNVGPLSSIMARNMTLDFNGNADKLGTDVISGTLFDADFTTDILKITAPGLTGDIKNFKLTSEVVDRGDIVYKDAASTLPVKVVASTGMVNLVDPKDTLEVHIRNTLIGALISAVNPSPAVRRNIALKLKGDLLNYTHGSTSIDVDHVYADVSADRRHNALNIPLFHAPKEWSVDNDAARVVKSMPRTLSFDLPQDIRNFFTQWNISAQLKMDKGMLLLPAFPVRNYLSDIDIYANSDSLNIRSFNIHSLKSGAGIQLAVSNIRQFLLNPEPAPLKINLLADIDTIQINQLAAAYERGVTNTQGAGEIERRLKHTAITPADSVAVVIPRNIFANVVAHIDQTEYKDVHFFDIDGKMNIKNGIAVVDTISAKAPFGSASGNLVFNSSDIENLNANVSLSNLDLDISDFFSTFPKLVEKIQASKNISGEIEANMTLSIKAFPTMYADVPSATSDLNVSLENLEIKQDNFIHRIAKMMLITDHNPINIENTSIHASVRDNLLMLNPFDFRFRNYHLTMTGLNNFGGDLFYHLGIEDSPIHIPFGINIKGTFRHPLLRFGGAKWKNSESTEITSNIMDQISINLIQTVRNENNKFIHKAALGATTPESDYVYFPKK